MIKSANRLISHRPEIKMNQKFIVIDGKTYKRVEEMLEDVHRKYESAMQALNKNQNGKPFILENMNLLTDKIQKGLTSVFETMPSFKVLRVAFIKPTRLTI